VIVHFFGKTGRIRGRARHADPGEGAGDQKQNKESFHLKSNCVCAYTSSGRNGLVHLFQAGFIRINENGMIDI